MTTDAALTSQLFDWTDDEDMAEPAHRPNLLSKVKAHVVLGDRGGRGVGSTSVRSIR